MSSSAEVETAASTAAVSSSETVENVASNNVEEKPMETVNSEMKEPPKDNKRKERDFDNRSNQDQREYNRSDNYRRDDRRDDRRDRFDDRRRDDSRDDRRGDYRRDDYRRDDRRFDDRRRDDRRDDRRGPRSDYNRPRENYPRDGRRGNEKLDNPVALQLNENVYIPPHKLRKLQQKTEDKSSEEFQKLNWEALKKSLNGIVNKVNASNLEHIVQEVFSENIIRGKGLLTRAIIKAQQSSNQFSNVYASLVAVINTRIPEIGELLLKRVVAQFLKSFKRNDKPKCISSCHFIAHLVNQQVASEILAGQILTLLLENATDDSVELAITLVKECGKTLLDVSPRILAAVFEAFRNILHDGKIERRVQYHVEDLFNIRKLEFKGFPSIVEELDLVEDDDRITHDSIELGEELDTEDDLDYFQFDPNFEENEAKYNEIKAEILGEEEEEEEEEAEQETVPVQEVSTEEDADKRTLLDPKTKTDESETGLKRTIYLTIMSSLTFEECAHKLIKSGLTKTHHMEVCSMVIECCSQERSYLDYYGCLAERFCKISSQLQGDFEDCFKIQYEMLHRYETNRLRNIARLYSHLLFTESISWAIFSIIKLTETDTTSYGRIFLKILFQDLQNKIGMEQLKKKLLDEENQQIFGGLFPKDNPKNVRFAINFWILIELPQLSDNLKLYLKEMANKVTEESSSDSSDSDSDDSDSDDSSSDSE